MSLFYRTFECPRCEHRWTLCQERDEAPPKFCPECGKKFAKTLAAVPGTHRIGGSTAAKSVDDVYRMNERAGEARMRLAEANGASPQLARQLKITNMRDNMREGDVAAIHSPMPNNPTTQFMGEAAKRGIRYGFGGGMGLAPSPGAPPVRIAPPIQTAEGAFTGPGHIGLRAAQMEHAANVRAVVASGKRMPTR